MQQQQQQQQHLPQHQQQQQQQHLPQQQQQHLPQQQQQYLPQQQQQHLPQQQHQHLPQQQQQQQQQHLPQQQQQHLPQQQQHHLKEQLNTFQQTHQTVSRPLFEKAVSQSNPLPANGLTSESNGAVNNAAGHNGQLFLDDKQSNAGPYFGQQVLQDGNGQQLKVPTNGQPLLSGVYYRGISGATYDQHWPASCRYLSANGQLSGAATTGVLNLPALQSSPLSLPNSGESSTTGQLPTER